MSIKLSMFRKRWQTDRRQIPTGKRKRGTAVKVIVVLVAVAAVGAGILIWRNQQSASAAATTIDVPIIKGDLDINVESSGKVQPSRNVPIVTQAGGPVTQVLVSAGDKVTKGQPLVRLDDHELQLAVEKAEAALKSAQAKLEDLKEGPSADEVASAQAALASAKANLDKVKAGSSAGDIADARSDLRVAQTKLDSVKAGPSARDKADAEAELAAARSKLAKVQAGPTKENIAEAEAELASAQAKLKSLQDGPSAVELSAAEADLKSAQLKLAALKSGPTDAQLSSARLGVTEALANLAKVKSSASVSKQQAEIDLAQAANSLRNAQDEYRAIADRVLGADGTLKSDLEQGQIDEYNRALRAMQDAEGNLHKAQLALDDARLAEIQDVNSAQAKVDDSNKQLQDLLDGPTASDLAEAQAAVDSAQKNLDKLKAPPSASDLADAQAAILKAQNNLAEVKAGPSASDLTDAQAGVVKAQNNLDDLEAGPSASDLADAQAGVDKAGNKLKELQAGSTRAQIAEAEAGVASAESSLKKLTSPASASDTAAAESEVVQAQAALDEAKLNLESATLVAPFDGTVAEVAAVVGSTISSGTKAVTLNDASGMHLDVELSESDVAKVNKGQPATITFDALPEQIITGTVTSIAPAASSSSSDVVTYLVQVQFNPGALPVKVGMSADANIQVEQHKGVLQVPNRAIKSQGPIKSVQLLYGKKQEPITVLVRTGATNGLTTEIVGCVETGNQCLREGDKVAMELPGTDSSSSGPGDNMVVFGGPPGKGGEQGGGVIFQQKVDGP